MKAVIQRVSQASVNIDGVKVADIQKGLLVLIGFEYSDTFFSKKFVLPSREIISMKSNGLEAL
jgi:D-tyrosyl-tRNA(Tyr) deacylase